MAVVQYKRSKYFAITELVCPHVYSRHKEQAWAFIDGKLIDIIDFLKEKYPNRKIIINNYNVKQGGHTQRGLRCNLCQLVKDKTKAITVYLSQHIFGAAIDFTVEGLTADQVRADIILWRDELPHPIRMESKALAPTYVHLDTGIYAQQTGQKITIIG